MILVDFAHLCNRYIFTAIANAKPKKKQGKAITSEYSGLFVHGVLTSLIYLLKDYSKEYGEMVLALEGKSWRKDLYPEYKAHRSKKRNDSEVIWEEVYEVINELSEALRDKFGIKAIQADKAEGDDVIATLVKNTGSKTLIVSSDKDFKQLCIYPHVSLFDPMKREMVKFSSVEEIKEDLKTHIIKGDDSDNIPSIVAREKFSEEFLAYLNSKDIYVTTPKEFFALECSKMLVDEYDVYEKYLSGKLKGQNKETKAIYKKTIMSTKKFKEVLNSLENKDNDYLIEQYEFNAKLIDLSRIPPEIEEEILKLYAEQKSISPNPVGMVEFCAKYRLMTLVKDVQYFSIKYNEMKESNLSSDEW